MKSLLDIITEEAGRRKWSDRRLCKEAGLKPDAVRNIRRGYKEKGDYTPGIDVAQAIAGAFGWSTSHLLGEPKPVSQGPTIMVNKPRAKVGAGVWSGEQDLVPVYETLAVAGFRDGMVNGKPLAHVAFYKGFLQEFTVTPPENLAIFKVHGTSMYPTLEENDLILADLTVKKVLEDGVYIIFKRKCLMVKRLLVNPYEDIVYIINDNPQYSSVQVKTTMKNVSVEGKVLLLLDRRL